MSAGETRAKMRYALSHWGETGNWSVFDSSAPDPTAGVLTELGELVEIVYKTKKGGLSRVEEFEHKFSSARPVLAYNEGGLIIVRAGSLYRVTARGIVG